MDENINPKRLQIVSLIYLLFPLVLGVIIFFYGISSQIGSINFVQIFTAPIYSNYQYTFYQTMFDPDFFLGSFWSNIIFCLIVVGYVILYGRSQREYGSGSEYPQLKKRAWVYGLVTLCLFVFLLLASIFNIGLNRPFLESHTFQILIQNLYPEQFSEEILAWVFFASGVPALLWLMARGNHASSQGKLNWKGMKYLVAVLVIVEIFLIFGPIRLDMIFDANTINELLFGLLDAILLIGCIGWIETREITKNLAENDEAGINSERPKNRLHHTIWYSILCVILILFYLYLFTVSNSLIDLSVYRWIQQFFTTAFRIFLGLLLYSWEAYQQKMKFLEEGGKMLNA